MENEKWRGGGQVAYMGKKINAYRALVGKPNALTKDSKQEAKPVHKATITQLDTR
jgi:hypothetical protein